MAPQPALRQSPIATRIRGEFQEMPGLCLTLQQARRLWALDDTTCAKILEALEAEGFLRRTPTGLYLRPDVRTVNAA